MLKKFLGIPKQSSSFGPLESWFRGRVDDPQFMPDNWKLIYKASICFVGYSQRSLILLGGVFVEKTTVGTGKTSQRTSRQEWNGGFLKWWYPTTMGFPTKSDHFEVFWGYHHLRKHPNHPKRLEPGSCHPWRLDGFKVNMLTEIIKTASAVLMPPVKPIPGEEIPKKKKWDSLGCPVGS